MTGYISHDKIVKARIFWNDESDGLNWNLDGIDGRGGYTEECARFATWGEAMAWVPFFLQGLL